MENNTKVKKPFYKRWWFIVIVAFVILGAIGNMLNEKDKPLVAQNTDAPNITNQESQNKEDNRGNTSQDKEKEDKQVYVNTAEAAELFTGDFVVGKDVKAGRYDITCEEGSGNFFIYDGTLLEVNAILTSSINEEFSIGVTKIQYDLVDGQKITISGINKVIFTPTVVTLSTTLCSGMHIVGRDVPAGDYIAIAPNGTGNFFIIDKLGMPRINEILGKSDIMAGFGVEKIKITLKESEKVVISGLELVELTK